MVEFDSRLSHTKDVIKLVPDALLLSAQHKRLGLTSPSQILFLTEMDFICEQLRVFNIS